MQKYLITTLVTANDYTQGAIGLFFSLQKWNPDIPFCVMITKNVDTKPYEELNILTKTIEKKQFCE